MRSKPMSLQVQGSALTTALTDGHSHAASYSYARLENPREKSRTRLVLTVSDAVAFPSISKQILAGVSLAEQVL